MTGEDEHPETAECGDTLAAQTTPTTPTRGPEEAEPTPPKGYKTSLCKFYLQGPCKNGEDCSYAHGTSQLRTSGGVQAEAVQTRSKTRLCANFLQYGECEFDAACHFAHGVAELQRALRSHGEPSPHQPFFKTELCKVFMNGGACQFGAQCQFAHGKHELRAKTKIDPQRFSAEERAKHIERSRQSPHYKTKLCEAFQADEGDCPFGDMCNFAHGSAELRPPPPPTLEPVVGNLELQIKKALKNPNYKTSLCHNGPECRYGDACRFAHSQVELQRAHGRPEPPPRHFKTAMCKNVVQGGYCQFGPECSFAHHPNELSPHSKFKSAMCHNMVQSGTCSRGERCSFAHSEDELMGSGYPSAAPPPYGPPRGPPRGPPPSMAGGHHGPPHYGPPKPINGYKTAMCPQNMEYGSCDRGSSCSMAHSRMELRQPGTGPAHSYGGGGGGGGGYGPPPPMDQPRPSHPKYKTSLCQNFSMSGYCERGDACAFAHGNHELRPAMGGPGGSMGTSAPPPGRPMPHGSYGMSAPSGPPPFSGYRFKTVMCRNLPNCPHGHGCQFAHSPHELSSPPDYSAARGQKRPNPKAKTALCKSYVQNEECTFGENCSFAHGSHELQAPELDYKRPRM